MTKAEKAASIIKTYAKDDSHGYDQSNRWGPDFDCSSLVISCYEEAGVPVKSSGASYTGNMYLIFRRCGFADVTDSVDLKIGSGLLPGDVLLNHEKHTAMYVGNGLLAQARVNEFGGVTGGKTGDQTGREIVTCGYYNFPWNRVLRLAEKETVTQAPTTGVVNNGGSDEVKLRILRLGNTGEDVRAAQILLIGRGYGCGVCGADGEFGKGTYAAVTSFQAENGLEADAEIGPMTWSKLLGV